MKTSLIGSIDFILLPVYYTLIYFIFLHIKNKQPNNLSLQRYFIKGFIVKILGTLFFSWLLVYYYKTGDSLSYFRDSLDLRRLISEGKISFIEIFTKDLEYFSDRFDLKGSVTNSGFWVTKVSFLLTYLSFSRFLITTVLMASLAYFGIFKMFQAFVSLAPDKHRLIAFITLFFPSVVIYGSGISKDTICISALGWFFYITQQKILLRKLKNFIIVAISFFLILKVKAYIIAAYMIPFCLFLIANLINKIKTKVIKVMAFIFLSLIFCGLYFVFQGSISDSLGAYGVDNLTENVKNLQNTYSNMSAEDAGSNFEIGEIEPTLGGLIKKMPLGIMTTLYRPFIWEISKPIILLSALESLAILLFTLYTILKTGLRIFIIYIFTDSVIFLFIGFSLIFSGFVGLSTLNFGTLARYRIPTIPFYLMALVVINSKKKLIQARQMS